MIEKKVSFHNISILVKTDNQIFVDYLNDYIDQENLEHEYDIEFLYNKKSSFPNFIKEGYRKYGSDLHEKNENEFITHAGHNLWLKIRIEEKKVSVQVIDKISKIKSLFGLMRYGKSYKYQRYMYLIRQGILLPAFYMFYKYMNHVTWHASALEIDGKNIAFSGLNGSGKSGLLLYLLNNVEKSKIISDNYILVEPNGSVLSVPEPVRVEKNYNDKNTLFEKKVCKAFGKDQLKPKKTNIVNQAKLDVMFSVELGNEFKVRKINAEKFNTRMFILHAFLAEGPEHNYFLPLAYLHDNIVLTDKWKEVSKSFCQSTQCYILTIPYEKNIFKRYENVTTVIKTILKELN